MESTTVIFTNKGRHGPALTLPCVLQASWVAPLQCLAAQLFFPQQVVELLIKAVQRSLSVATGQLGDSLQRLAAQRTASLKPAHQWVPWVVVNGIPLLDDDENVSTGFFCCCCTAVVLSMC